MIEIRKINVLEHFDEASTLLELNWSEQNSPIELNKEDTRKFYEVMASLHALYGLAAYSEDKLVGYLIATIHPFPLNHSVRVCNIDGLFVVEDYRGGPAFNKMQEAIRQIAKDNGASYIHWHAPTGSMLSGYLMLKHKPLTSYFYETVDHE